MVVLILKSFFALSSLIFSVFLIRDGKKNGLQKDNGSFTTAALIGSLTNFFDTLGVGSFATSTVLLRTFKQVSDKMLPGTLNVMSAIPTLVQGFIFLSIVQVDSITLIGMMTGAGFGGWLGAKFVSKLPEQKIRLGMSIALAVTATIMLMNQLHLMPAATHDAMGLTGFKLVIAFILSPVIAALSGVGIGFYAPCMATVYLLGMSAKAAFPIMMCGCAMSAIFSSIKYIKSATYNRKVTIAMTFAGVIGVLIAGYIVKSLPLNILMWVVIAVVYYSSVTLFFTFYKNSKKVVVATEPAVASLVNIEQEV